MWGLPRQRVGQLVPKRVAIADNVSPGRTV
jgi:hypothetical protein